MAKEITRYLEEEMEESYLNYSMSVIVSRAIPDVKDGLEPVARRILFAMQELGNTNDKPHKKSARVVGEVLGKFHPHGDSSVYGAVVRMAQDFSYRYPLVDGHGNFGSIDGDAAASLRYTECRLTKLSGELLADIDKNTVDWRKNFDETLDEPVILPSKLPNLLLNGSEGIAVGMATKIPTHNLGELCNGLLALIDNKEITIDELIEHIPGPDFPTAGIIYGKKGIHDAYQTGRGKIRVSGKLKVEEIRKGKEAIIITELPYQVNKARLIERIAELVKEKKISGITDLRDESDRTGMRVVIEIKRGEEPDLIINNLYKHTELQTTFGVIMLALVNNAPKVLTLKEILEHHLEHRIDVITRRTKFDLDKAERRMHLIEGLKIALTNVDPIIETIKNSVDSNTAKDALMLTWSFTEVQAKAILDIKLQRLTSFEKEKLEAEYQSLETEIEGFKEILNNESKLMEVIKTEIIELKEKYGDARRTQLETDLNEINIEDLIKDEKVIVTLTNKGYIKRVALDQYKAQKRGGKGISTQNTVDEDFVESMYTASTLETLMIFTDKGKVYSLKVYEIPESGKQARGKLIENLINLSKDEKVERIIKINNFSEEQELFFLTKQGRTKLTNLSLFQNLNRSGIIAIKLDDDDGLIFVGVVNGNKDKVFVVTKLGYAIKFGNENIRSMGRNTAGVKALTLREGDSVVSGVIIEDEELDILTITENGYGKRTKVSGYPLQNRGGKGVINIKVSNKLGNVVDAKCVHQDEELMAITSEGIIIRTPIESISQIGRNTKGVRLMKVKEEEKVVSIVCVKQNLEAELEEETEE